MSKDLTSILKDWPSQSGVIRARKLLSPADGREFLQLRVDLGVIQMELDGRPDGERPHGYETMLAYLSHRAGPQQVPLELSESEKEEIVREMLQYYRRRISLIALADQAKIDDQSAEADACFARAVRDADHNLSMLDLLKTLSTDAEFAAEHEQYRPFILMHRTVCLAERELLEEDPDTAIEHIKAGSAAIESFAEEQTPDAGIPGAEEEEEEPERLDVQPFMMELERLEQQVRRDYKYPQTLREQLDAALAAEDYEAAARLRDAIARRESAAE
jgi:hypothetical protein